MLKEKAIMNKPQKLISAEIYWLFGPVKKAIAGNPKAKSALFGEEAEMSICQVCMWLDWSIE